MKIEEGNVSEPNEECVCGGPVRSEWDSGADSKAQTCSTM